ncbi:MAG: tetrahydromethanopterin S-methyltransferase subunit A [Nitrosopumilaceae archaeon]|jgi:tetrahydromethanopterin S-methyltransferase subunit A|uniref:Tetrahydromethanopterin S-methyltransferase subunit A n=2 Tax=Candidatus Nitrosomaritimum aestuariumsis TaxID=3342354 RepID=A0AC60VW77_9ARCH|nr:tetrahydromethanopterin S-methyltransferase subunit A [Nitrosopumilaceae archaeon]MBA4460840.1 tetrahydromethanopterin S-methyltransferase subunit A [Nitrosopumilaceae archaeon]MBA4463265.1 tetrahydromethanopterin S-methyltransferase subunit A [Nitrosopumilaceae archaeon]
MNNLGNWIGEICAVILPINEKSYNGNSNSSIAVCTLSSIDLLRKISKSDLMNDIYIVGRLLSENKGIDSMIQHVNQNKKINKIIVCGKEVWGHKAGHSLFQLHQNGIDNKNRIIGSKSPDPILTAKHSEIKYFQKEIKLINLIGETSLKKISQHI